MVKPHTQSYRPRRDGSHRRAPTPIGASWSTDRMQGDADRRPVALSELVDHITGEHHLQLAERLPYVQGLLLRETMRDGRRYACLGDLLQRYESLQQTITSHIYSEEEVLFPLLRQLAKANRQQCCRADGVMVRLDEARCSHTTIARDIEAVEAMTHRFTPPARSDPTYLCCLDALRSVCEITGEMLRDEQLLYESATSAQTRRRVA